MRIASTITCVSTDTVVTLAASLTKTVMASKMSPSRSQLDRVLDPDNLSIQLDTLIKAARAVGKMVEIKISKTPRVASA